MRQKFRSNDRSLIKACIRKDLNAWSLLVSKYTRLVGISAVNRLKKYGVTLPKEDIEDIRQDVFKAIWGREMLRAVAGSDDISHWLAIVSGNMAIDHIRNSANKHQLKKVPLHKELDGCLLSDILPSRTLRPELDAAEADLAERIDGAIGQLPCRERLIMELLLMHGKKYEEIAELTGMPGGTVSSYARRAREKLKVMLKEFLTIFAIILAPFTSIYIGGFYD